LAYAAGSALHRRVWLRPVSPIPGLPLIVIGSLRAGGAGKTAVTLELARRLQARGRRVGILVYRIRGGAGEIEAGPRSDWRDSSDEAVLLARASGARVFATRDRAATWRRLGGSDRTEGFDVLLSDDGLMDTRLAGAPGVSGVFKLILAQPGERPGLTDLLPAGPYHLTAAALGHADHTLPLFREIVLPGNFDFEKHYWILCGIGNPAAFRRDLENAGVRVAGMTAGVNHGAPALERARRKARRAGSSGFLFTAKDGIKLAGRLREGDKGIEIGETVALPAAFLSAVDAFLALPSS
jgi:tetraacyldisaccharide 4'-kinase